MRFAVIENEFGEIGVDQRILNERVNDEVIEGASQVTGPWDVLDPYICNLGHLRSAQQLGNAKTQHSIEH